MNAAAMPGMGWYLYGSSQLARARLAAGGVDVLKGAGRSRWQQCRSHYFIGVMRLSQGDRTGAEEHLRAAVATRATAMWAWDVSRVFLARLRKTDAWPPWIPLKE